MDQRKDIRELTDADLDRVSGGQLRGQFISDAEINLVNAVAAANVGLGIVGPILGTTFLFFRNYFAHPNRV